MVDTRLQLNRHITIFKKNYIHTNYSKNSGNQSSLLKTWSRCVDLVKTQNNNEQLQLFNKLLLDAKK